MLPVTDEQAKAVTATGGAVSETAKLGQAVVKAIAGAGAYLDRTVGTLPADAVSLMGGAWIHEVAIRNRERLKLNTQRKLAEMGVTEPVEPSPSVMLPLLEAAERESRDELQELWASLLASAMSPDGGLRVRRAYIEIVGAMEPTDAQLFHAYTRVMRPDNPKSPVEKNEEVRRHALNSGLSPEEFEISRDNLEKLRLIDASPSGNYYIRSLGLALASALGLRHRL